MIDLDPGADPGACRQCGNAEITEQFRRVYGDNDDVAHRCPECDSYRRLYRGSAAGKDLPGHPDPEVAGHHGNAIVADGGRVDRAQTNVAVLAFALITTLLFGAAVIMVVSAA